MFSVGLAGRCFVRLYRSREAPRAKNSIDVKIARTDGGLTRYSSPSVGAAAGCDLLILLLKIKIKRSQPSAAPTGLHRAMAWIRVAQGYS